MSTDAERRSRASRKGWRSRRAMQIARAISNPDGGPQDLGGGRSIPERDTAADRSPVPTREAGA